MGKKKKNLDENGMLTKRPVDKDTAIFLFIFALIVGYGSWVMGAGNFINSVMNSASYMITDVVIYLAGLGGVMGAVAALLSEFGVIALINKLLSPLMRPIYGMPGATIVGGMSSFLSDSPAIISCAQDKNFIKYFKPYQRPLLCNFGCAYGMGLIVVSFFIGQGIEGGVTAAFIGLFSALVGSVISVHLMSRHTRKYYKISKEEWKADRSFKNDYVDAPRKANPATFERVLNTMLDGAKSGIAMGRDIFPCAVTIAIIILMCVWGPGEGGVYDGSACQGLNLLPRIGEVLLPVTKVLFGFQDGLDIIFPMTSIAACGAAMGLVPAMKAAGTLCANDIAVFVAMGMCWSGYLANVAGMMEALKERKFTTAVIITHTIGGLCAGIVAHLIMLAIGMG